MFVGEIWRESAEAHEMSFEVLLDQACISARLPEMERIQLTNALSVDTKEMLLKLPTEEVGVVLSSAIDAVNHGSIKPIDKLVREQLNR